MRTRSVATADERILDVAEAATRAGARLVSFSGPGYGSTASGPGPVSYTHLTLPTN